MLPPVKRVDRYCSMHTMDILNSVMMVGRGIANRKMCEDFVRGLVGYKVWSSIQSVRRTQSL